MNVVSGKFSKHTMLVQNPLFRDVKKNVLKGKEKGRTDGHFHSYICVASYDRPQIKMGSAF